MIHPRGRFLVAAALAVALASTETDAAAEAHKYALAVMHFNVQYVAGGMVGFWAKADPKTDRTEDEIEDQIIVESFEPVLDLLLKHPTWGTAGRCQQFIALRFHGGQHVVATAAGHFAE